MSPYVSQTKTQLKSSYLELVIQFLGHPPKTDIIIFKKIITMGKHIIHRFILNSLLNNKKSNPLYSMMLILLIAGWAIGIGEAVKITTDNTCTFRQQGKLFSLVMLNKGSPYEVTIDKETKFQFNFCEPFLPTKCNSSIHDNTKAYSFVVKLQHTTGMSLCQPYSSDSKTHNFVPYYTSDNGNIILNLTMQTQSLGYFTEKYTDFVLDCVPLTQDNEELQITRIQTPNAHKVIVYARTPYACPVFQISSIWKALTDNLFIFGFILFIVGFIMLFFGILMTHLMIFIAAYFLSFAGLTGIFTAFLGPNSSTLIIYFSLLFILFLSTLIAYCLTRLVNVSIFLIGAFLGFILAAIINSIFCKVVGIYSIWSLVFFEVALIIPFGLLTFKYSKQIIVMSTSLTGAYMVVRPFSWIFGGFPNEFTLSEMINNGQLQTLPWTFFLYLIAIIAIAILGGLYQILKLKRKTVEHVESNFITQNVEQRIDRIKQAVENIINRYAPDTITGEQQRTEQYSKMKEMSQLQVRQEQKKIQQPSKTKQRKSKEEYF